jgi:LAO/AO transport system kinase
VIVVNKANHPLTDSMVREIKGVLALGPPTDWDVPVLRTEATEGEGIEELAGHIDAHHDHIASAGTLAERRRRNLMNEVLGLATIRMRRELETSLEGDEGIRDLLDKVVKRELDPATAAERLLDRNARQ